MTYVEVLGTMQAIEARIAQLAPPASRTSAASATSFASALDGAGATSSADGALLASDGVTGDDVVAAAKQYEGVPYVLGGESKAGIDCSGLVQAAFKDLGVDVPRLVRDQKNIGQEIGSLAEAQPGDLIVLNGGDHIAIWGGNGQAIHAPYPGRTVSVQKAWFDDDDVVTIRRVVPATSGSASAVGGATAGLSAETVAQATSMLGGDASGASLTSMLGGAGLAGTGSVSTAQQLLAARAALTGTAA